MSRKIALPFALIILLCLGISNFCLTQSLNAPPRSLWAGLNQLAQVRSIDIHDDWMGLTELGPVGKQYIFKPDGERFTGKAIFSLGGGPLTKTKEEPIAIPKETVRDFLRLLSQATLEKGEYKPNIEHTDDYPSVAINIQLGIGKLSFFSQSQGEWAIPWGATLNGEAYVIRSRHPAEAMKLLQPYLKEDSMAKFTEEVRAQLKQGK